ncbi:site-specific integrase [Microvirga sp. GCM10011540]|uniref:site-specific integrase n=1 Tax=Microvirga sp. GCM10011540 TaxID=3317338 RepID=UPI00361A5D39
MPRRSKGARLWLKPAEYKNGVLVKNAVWCIKDDGKRSVTGHPEASRAEAEKALADYIAAKYQPNREADRPAAQVLVTDVLSVYAEEVAVGHTRPHKTAERLVQLGEWWKGKTLADITGKTCRAYAKWRKSHVWKAARPDVTGTAPRKVGDGGARRELEDLRAAVNYYIKEGYCREHIEVTLPPRGQPRDRYLERDEAAQLLWHMWKYREPQTIHRGARKGTVIPGKKKKRQHLARFMLVGLYTGTRAGAICSAGFEPKEGQGWVDLERGVFHRKRIGAKETKKRQPPVKLPAPLLAHIRRWSKNKRRDGSAVEYVVEYQGKPVADVGKAFAAAVKDAGLGPDVTPHVLRHTCATWLMQMGVDLWEAAGFLGMTVQTLERVYGHHRPDYQSAAAAALTGANRRDRAKLQAGPKRDRMGPDDVVRQLDAAE